MKYLIPLILLSGACAHTQPEFNPLTEWNVLVGAPYIQFKCTEEGKVGGFRDTSLRQYQFTKEHYIKLILRVQDICAEVSEYDKQRARRRIVKTPRERDSQWPDRQGVSTPSLLR